MTTELLKNSVPQDRSMGKFYYLFVYVVSKVIYLNFKAVLALPKTPGSAQTHKSISFIWIVWSTLYTLTVILEYINIKKTYHI